MTSIDDIPTVEEVFRGLNRPPQRASTSAFNDRLSDLARAVTSGGDVRGAARNAVDVMPGKTSRTKPAPYDRAERVSKLPQTLRNIRANHGHPPGKGWKPNRQTVKQWAKEQQNATYMDFSGASTCFESLVWHVEPGETGPDAMGTMVAVFINRGNPVEYSYPEISRSDAIAWGAGSEGGWFAEHPELYDAYLD
jgi:hypothetical protein